MHKAQPYVKSKTDYLSGGGSDFYEPFPASETYSVTGATGTVQRVDGETIKVQFSAISGTTASLDVSSIKNPYSQLQSINIVVRHFAGCGSAPTACANGNCEVKLFFDATNPYFTGPPAAEMVAAQPTSQIFPAPGQSDDIVGSTDGSWEMKFKPSAYFPKYGGQIVLTLPPWYDAPSA